MGLLFNPHGPMGDYAVQCPSGMEVAATSTMLHVMSLSEWEGGSDWLERVPHFPVRVPRAEGRRPELGGWEGLICGCSGVFAYVHA